jgi:hypothetical protein
MAAALAFGACENAGDPLGDANDGQGRLTIQLTDAPGDLKAAFIKIERFVLIPSDETQPRLELEPDVSGFVELLVLADGKLLNVVDAAIVPIGSYSEVRVVLDEAFVVLHDDRVFATPGATLPVGVEADGELKCPSCGQSGYKLKFTSGGLVVDDASLVVIDFDAASSFGHEAGKSGKWIMHPVLRASSHNIPFGRITGIVTLATGISLPACGGQPNTFAVFRPTATLGADTFVGSTDTLGVYNIASLVPATYALGHIGEVTFTNGDSLTLGATVSQATVTVASGDSAKANYQITSAVCH